jgi:mannose-6-phosphate isomerase
MRKVEKPWGYEEIWAHTDKYLGKILTILPGHRLSLQYHKEKEETLYVLEGKLIVWASEDDTGKFIFNKGAVYHVKPGQVHRFGSPKGSKLTRLIEVSSPEIDDVIRLADDYKR